MTDKELSTNILEVSAIDNEIKKMKSRKADLISEIQEEHKKRILNNYPDIKIGDKVKVVYEPKFYWQAKNVRSELIGFFCGVFLKVWDKESIDIKDFRFKFMKIKKDGTMSQVTLDDTLRKDEIISITRVE